MLLLERTGRTFRIRLLFVQFPVSPNEMNEKIPSKIEKYSRRAAVIVPNALPFHSTCVSELINKFHLKKKNELKYGNSQVSPLCIVASFKYIKVINFMTRLCCGNSRQRTLNVLLHSHFNGLKMMLDNPES